MFRGVLLLALCALTAANEECIENGRIGMCVSFDSCASAKEGVKYHIQPTTCWKQGMEYIVCCFDHLANTPTKAVEWQEVNDDADDNDDEAPCPPVPANETAPQTGRKAWDMCLKYQEVLYPCEKSPGGVGKKTRANDCILDVAKLILGGEDAQRDEYPHMVLLGYVTGNDVYWLCGGSLISDKFVLTAGHCIASSQYGVVTYAYVGALKRSEVTDSKNKYKIKQIHKHPDYRSPKKYNDIALLELAGRVNLSRSVVPACLPVGRDYDDSKAMATGWGVTAYKGEQSDRLQKVDLWKFPTDECEDFFPPARYLERGFDVDTQICYGDSETSKDACQGDSGGPLQIRHPQIHCMHMVVGVTSAGYACGVLGQPGLYTRVAHYVPWIEAVVWP